MFADDMKIQGRACHDEDIVIPHWDIEHRLSDWAKNSLPNSFVGIPTPLRLQSLKKAAHHHLFKDN